MYRAHFLVFLALSKVDFWCPEPFGRMYLGYENLFSKFLPSSFSLKELIPRIIPGVVLRRQLSNTFFLNFLWPSLKLNLLPAGTGPFACLACASAFGRCIQDVVDQLMRTDEDRYAAPENLPGKPVNRNVGGSRRPQAGESNARVARTQILVYMYIYIYIHTHIC